MILAAECNAKSKLKCFAIRNHCILFAGAICFNILQPMNSSSSDNIPTFSYALH